MGIQIGIKDQHVTVIAPIEGTPAHAAGIETGDVILKVDETPTKDLTLMEAVQRMRGPKGTSVTLTVRREGAPETLSFTIIRDTIKIQSVRSRLLDDHIGYVRISQFQESTPTGSRRGNWSNCRTRAPRVSSWICAITQEACCPRRSESPNNSCSPIR